MSYLEAGKEPSAHKRKRSEEDEGERAEGDKGIPQEFENMEQMEEGFSKEDDLLLEDLIGGAGQLPPETGDDLDGFGVVFASENSNAEGHLGGDASQIDLMAREILEDSSQSQGTLGGGYGPGRKRPRRDFGSAQSRPKQGDDDAAADDSVSGEEEEVVVVEEEEEEDEELLDEAGGARGKGVRLRDEEDDDDEDADVDDDDDDEGDEEEQAGRSRGAALGSKGLFAGKGKAPSKVLQVKKDDDDSDDDDDESVDQEEKKEEDEENEHEEDEEEDEEEEEEEDDEGKVEHTLTRAHMDRYLDVDAKISLMARAVRQCDAESEVATLLTSALLQLANTRPDFAALVEKEIEHAKEEDYDSDDETEEKVELPEEETIEGWLIDADPADFETLRTSFLKDLLRVPFKAKLNGERCTVMQAVGGDNLLVRQLGESFVCSASALSGAQGRNGALLAEWKLHRNTFK